MATGVKFNVFVKDMVNGVHAALLYLDTDVAKIYLTNATPSVSLDLIKTDLAEITNENGYTAPIDVANAFTHNGDKIELAATDQVVTASGGTVGPFQHVILYNDTPTSPVDPLIAYWTRAAGAITLQDGETFTTDFGATAFIVG